MSSVADKYNLIVENPVYFCLQSWMATWFICVFFVTIELSIFMSNNSAIDLPKTSVHFVVLSMMVTVTSMLVLLVLSYIIHMLKFNGVIYGKQ